MKLWQRSWANSMKPLQTNKETTILYRIKNKQHSQWGEWCEGYCYDYHYRRPEKLSSALYGLSKNYKYINILGCEAIAMSPKSNDLPYSIHWKIS